MTSLKLLLGFLPLVTLAQAADPKIAAAVDHVSEEHVRKTIETLAGFHSRNTLGGPGPAADWIEAQLKSYSAACNGCLEVKRETWTEPVGPRVPKPVVMSDIYAILRGTDPAQASRVNLVTGHYDSRANDVLNVNSPAPGANDDASGVAVSLECARVLSQQKWPSTIVFAAVSGEEQNLLGSRHLAQLAKRDRWQIEAAFNNDIVGGNTTPGDQGQRKDVVRVFSEGIPVSAPLDQVQRIMNLGLESDSPSREVAREVATVAETYTNGFGAALIFRRDRYLRGGDHSSFNAEGFPAVRFTEWREDFHHQHQDPRVENGVQFGDFLQFVDFGYVRNVARLNAAALAVMASAPGVPSHVKLQTSALDNNSTLNWEAPEGAPAGTRYELVWRDTNAGQWQHSEAATSETTITVPISKDNVIFGVRSIDTATGVASPAAAAE